MTMPNQPAAPIDGMRLGGLRARADRGDTAAAEEIRRLIPDPVAYYERRSLEHGAAVGNPHSAERLARLYPETVPAPTPVQPPQVGLPEPAAASVPPSAEDLDALRTRILQTAGLEEADAVLLTGTTAEQLLDQANAVRALYASRAPAVPVFAPNPGQAAGNTAPPAPSGMNRGRELYHREKAAGQTGRVRYG
ncbi:hypothetical protein [Pseudonocardia xishanensis]|uniref:Uncharacterized protein n=1 Tax=Pseudonocardia xishanensis TaxID=630995 RepID=A0ABP8RZ76_9PSEU